MDMDEPPQINFNKSEYFLIKTNIKYQRSSFRGSCFVTCEKVTHMATKKDVAKSRSFARISQLREQLYVSRGNNL